MSSIFSLAYL
jgi:hypothetical protein